MEGKRNTTATTTFVAIITAAAVVFCQLFYYEVHAAAKSEAKTEQQEPTGDQAFLTPPSGNLPGPSAVVPHHAMFFLFEISFEREVAVPVGPRILLPPNRIYRTLIESVISPNAP